MIAATCAARVPVEKNTKTMKACHAHRQVVHIKCLLVTWHQVGHESFVKSWQQAFISEKVRPLQCDVWLQAFTALPAFQADLMLAFCSVQCSGSKPQ
jgi:hypothetical protein